MRNLSKLGLLLILALSLSSCKKIKSWFDVEFDTTLNGDLYIYVEEPALKAADFYEFSDTVYVDPLGDDEIAKYQDNINHIEVTNIVATVSWVSEEGIVFNTGTIITATGSQTATWELDEPWTLHVNDQLILGDNVNSTEYNKVTTMLSNQESLMIVAAGECNMTGVSVTLTVGIDCEVTANPL